MKRADEPIHVVSVSLNVSLIDDHQMLKYYYRPIHVTISTIPLIFTEIRVMSCCILLLIFQRLMVVIEIHIESHIDHKDRFIVHQLTPVSP